ncbi:TonB-dependent receptor [Pedobacter sp. MW01-1-1]|uniref:TonB-dependent receptor n=1 Tax=Pedobacter sp. MW01-1-1 TaxID=3383027 RepID=UPI003FEDD0D8
MKNIPFFLCFMLGISSAYSQNVSLWGRVTANLKALEDITVQITSLKKSTKSDSVGVFVFEQLPEGVYELKFSGVGYQSLKKECRFKAGENQMEVRMQAIESNLEDVIITGVNRATELRKSPVPIAVLSKRTMDQNVNTNLIEAIVKGIPGLTAVTTGPNVSKPFIRGLGYNRVLTLYDGLRQEGQQWGDEHGIEVDEYDISRVEVVKGPASLTYGSDALAGVLNLIPLNHPLENNRLEGDFTTNYQSNNGLVGSSFGLSYRHADWQYHVRASGKVAHNYENKIDGRVYGTAFREYNFSGSARVDKKWGYSKTAVTYYNNLMEIPDGSRDSLSRRFTKQVLDELDDIKNRPFVPENELSQYTIQALHQHIQHSRLYNQSQIKLGGSDLTVLLGVQQSVRREYNHPTVPSQAGLYVVLNTANYDIKYNLPVFAGFESTFGLNGMYQSNRSKDATDFPIPDYNLWDIGAFYYVKKSMGKLDLSTGIRYDKRAIQWDDFYVGTNPETGFGQESTANDLTANHQFTQFRKNYYGLSGSFGLTYNFSKKLVLKANIARGYRAPNITEIGSNGLDPGAHIVYLGNRNFKPEFNWQEDLGLIAYLKEFDLSVEVFNNSIQNYIYQSRLTDENGNPVVVVPGNLTFQYQQAKARLYGAEITANWHPSEASWLNFNNSLAYVVGLNKNEIMLAQYGAAAKYLPFVPPLQARSEIKLMGHAFGKNIDKPYVKIDALFSADQDKFYALDNTETFTAGYILLNAGIGFSIKRKKEKVFAEIFAQCDNVLNKAYQSHLNRLKYFEYYEVSPNNRYGIYNMGRNFSFKVRVPF